MFATRHGKGALRAKAFHPRGQPPGYLIAFLPLLFAHRTALADEQIPTRVEFSAPNECPTKEVFQTQLLFRSVKIAISTDASALAKINVAIAKRGAKFEGKFEVRNGELTTKRNLSAPRCETVVGAAALSVALLLDPEGARTEAPSELLSAPLPIETPLPKEEPPPEPVLPIAPLTPSPPIRSRPREVAKQPWELGVGLRSALTSAIQGIDTELGGEAYLAHSSDHLRAAARISAAWLPGKEVRQIPGVISYGGATARLAGCLAPGAWGGLRLGREVAWLLEPCAGLSARILSVRAPSAAIDRPSTRLLVSPSIVLRGGVLTKKTTFGVELEASVATAAERFRIEPLGEVFALPRVHFSAGGFANFPLL